MAAYAAASPRKLRTSIFVCVLIAAVIAFVLVNTVMLTIFKMRMTARAGEAATSKENNCGEISPKNPKFRMFRWVPKKSHAGQNFQLNSASPPKSRAKRPRTQIPAVQPTI